MDANQRNARDQDSNSDFIIADYLITASSRDIERIARETALEQTVEVPEDIVDTLFIERHVVGRILSVKEAKGQVPEKYLVKMAYSVEVADFQIPQLLNLLFGNISMKQGIKIVDIILPETFTEKFQGPAFGIEGLRDLLNIHDRPLTAAALKPMGRSAEELAEASYQLALGGVDILKDDHGLTDNSFCRFKDRVRLCSSAVRRAVEETGKKCLYFPNILDRMNLINERIEYALEHHAGGLLMSPFLLGFDQVRFIAENPAVNIPIMGHPSLSGTLYNNPTHGIEPHLILGTLFRLAGADISIYPNAGGRFCFSEYVCSRINASLQSELNGLRKAWPAPAGGINLESAPEICRSYGKDIILLIGGSLYQHSPDLRRNAEYFLELAENCESVARDKEIKRRHKRPQMKPHAEKASNRPANGLSAEPFLKFKNFLWDHRSFSEYKPADSSGGFRNINRLELMGRGLKKTGFDLRYFEIQKEGYSSLEKHRHAHVIIAARGQGIIQIGEEEYKVNPFDVVFVDSWKVHRLKNPFEEPFGFFCIVDSERDKPIQLKD